MITYLFGGIGYIDKCWKVDYFDSDCGWHTYYVDAKTKEDAIKQAKEYNPNIIEIKVYLERG